METGPTDVRSAPAPLVVVEALQPFVSHSGGGWNTGEVAAFPPEVARSLIARGVARAVPKADTLPGSGTSSPMPPAKAPAGPPQDKQIKRPIAKK